MSEVLVDRRQEILDAVEFMVAMHAEWEADEKAPPQPSAALEEAVLSAISVCGCGDVPGDMRDVLRNMDGFADEWRRYANGHARKGAIPHASLWEAFRNVEESIRVAQMPATMELPSVAHLFEELKDFPGRDTQIAKMYGTHTETSRGPQWTGPFFGPNGQVLSEKIKAEATTPGSVLSGDWVHPEVQKRNAERADVDQRRKQRQRDMAAIARKEDPVQLLKEGQFVRVVAKHCGMTEGDVRALASQHGIEINEPEDVQTTAQAAKSAPPKAAKPKKRATPDKTESSISPEVAELIVELAAGDAHGADEIAQQVSEASGDVISAADVAAFLRERKRAETAAKA